MQVEKMDVQMSNAAAHYKLGDQLCYIMFVSIRYL